MQTNPHRHIVRRAVYTLLALATIVFIFYNSGKTGAVSTDASLRVLDVIDGFFTRLHLGWRFPHTLVRKLGHVGEYALLGLWLTLALRAYLPGRRGVLWAVPAGLVIAACDELYQTFIPGREGAVRDVLIDLAGIFLGLGLALLARRVWHRWHRKHE